MKRLAVKEFQARCLQVISDLQKDRIPVIITNEDRAVAKLVSMKQVAPSVRLHGRDGANRRRHRITDLVNGYSGIARSVSTRLESQTTTRSRKRSAPAVSTTVST